MSWFTGQAISGDLFLLVAVAAMWLPVSLGGLPLLCGGLFVAVGGVGTLQLELHGWPLPTAVLTATAIAALAGASLGAIRRVAPPTFALVTWALSWLAIVFASDAPQLTGGDAGLVGPSPQRWVLPALGIHLTVNDLTLIVIGAIAALAALAVNAVLVNERIGLSLRALRDGQELAESLGCRAEAIRLPVLMITAAWLALAGAGIAVTNNVVSVSDDGPLLGLQLVLAVLLGAWPSLRNQALGPLTGTIALIAIDHVATTISNSSSIDVDTATAIFTAAAFALVLIAPRFLLISKRIEPSERIDTPAPTEARAATEPGDVLLELTNLTHRYASIDALLDVSLQLRAGELLAVIGSNGSGKSTLLRIATGDLRPTAGTIAVRGRSRRPRDPAAMIKAGVVRCPQVTSLIDSLTVREHVELGSFASTTATFPTLRRLARTPQETAARSQREARVKRAIADVGLSHLADVTVDRLDISARPFVLIAAAVATGATVICLDEPAAGLDDTARQELIPVMQNLCGAGYGLVLIEHDLDLVNHVADRVMQLHNGRVIQEDVASAAPATP